MAHTKSGGSTKNGRDSNSNRLGIKINNSQSVQAGEIILRQRGTKYLLGKNVKRAGDDTIYAAINGVVKYASGKKKRFDGSTRYATIVNVESVKQA